MRALPGLGQSTLTPCPLPEYRKREDVIDARGGPPRDYAVRAPGTGLGGIVIFLEPPRAPQGFDEPIEVVAVGSVCTVYRCRFSFGLKKIEGVFKIARDARCNGLVAIRRHDFSSGG